MNSPTTRWRIVTHEQAISEAWMRALVSLRAERGQHASRWQRSLLPWGPVANALLRRMIAASDHRNPSRHRSEFRKVDNVAVGDRFHTTANDRQRRWTGLGNAGDDRHLQGSR